MNRKKEYKMSEDAHKTTEGAVLIKRIGRNVLNVGIFLVEVLFLILAGPALLKFFMPVVLGWLIACIANPLVKFLEKRLHIVRKHSSFVVILGAILLIVLGCYYLLPGREAKNLWLVAASLLFYAFSGLWYVLLLLFSVFCN